MAYATFGAIAIFIISANTFAEDRESREESFKPQGQTANQPETISSHFKQHLRVRCDRGESLSVAIRRAREHQTVRFSGTCYESLVINKDHLTLLGEKGGTIDGSQLPSEAVLLIDGARGFELDSFTVQNGSDQGILATHQAQGVLKNIVAQNNATVGLSVDRSHVEIVNVALDNNQTGGMDAYTGSTVVAKGTLSAVNNGGDGLAVNGKTFFELRGATVTASQNAGNGVSIINDSRLQIFSFPEAQGSTVTADNNGFAGIGILGSELGVVGSQYFGSGANVISANNNGVFGFFAPAGAILSPHATAKFVASGNGVGMLLEDGASILIIGGLDLSQNGAGLSAHGAGTMTIVSVPPNPSNVDANQIDFDLGFGTRLTSDGVGFTSIACDSTVLTRGISCP
ncbi:MAG: right-handed parallel beta-helix repeat-containing protein [Lysobacterales bacterium]